MDRTEKFMKKMTEIEGISGFEHQVANLVKEELGNTCEYEYDNLGSLVCKHVGTAENTGIMMAGHMDEIGFIVQQVTEDGFIKFLPVGGWWPGNVLAQKVAIQTRKGRVLGVIGSPAIHDMDKEKQGNLMKLKDLFIDVGQSVGYDVIKKLDIRPGDPITPITEFEIMSNKKMYLAKAWDNRVGVLVMAEAMRRLVKMKHPNIAYGVGTTQEEVGLRGAKTAAALCKPDVAFALDVCTAKDTGSGNKGRPEKLGNGVGIMVFDRSLIPNMKLRDFMIDLAEKHKIKHFLGVLDNGGTDAGRINLSGTGILSMYIGIASRYIHSHISVIHRDDFDAAVELMVQACMALDKKTVESLKSF
ncbi:MAG: M42 family metallopeptidase [Candidatus Coatesbacteria bacterium]|nr:M42 family metallopeptidase [Candidatus Coatesbacteria bacterium]